MTAADFWNDIADDIDPAVGATDGLPEECEGWLRRLFPVAVSKPFAPDHRPLLDWAWEMGPERPRPLVMALPRRGGKSTLAELVATIAGTRGRHYCIIFSATQDLADKRVSEVALALESSAIATYYPAMGERKIGKFSKAKGWSRSRLVTASGYTVEAVGMEGRSIRGFKEAGRRPDLIIGDDFDVLHDSIQATAKKMATLTQSILPMGAENAAVLLVQNVMIPDGIMAQMCDGRATALANRIVVGPIPAIRGLQTYQWKMGEEIPEDVRAASEVDLSQHQGTNDGHSHRTLITHGTPTWPEGLGIAVCQAQIDDYGIQAFLREQQHEVDEVEGALWRKDIIGRAGAAPDLVRIVVAVDPAVGGGDEIGIGAVGIDRVSHLYVLEDATLPGDASPKTWGSAVGEIYSRRRASLIVAEKNQGGKLVESTIKVFSHGGANLPVKLVWASERKEARAEPVVVAYEDGRVFHVGVFPELERQMTRWVRGNPSPGRIDWLVWACTELLNPDPVPQRTWSPGLPA